MPLVVTLVCLCASTQAVDAEQQNKPRWALTEVPWLASLQAAPVVAELQALADADLHADATETPRFRSSFGPNADLAGATGGWSALVLMNKARLDDAGCRAAPLTCAALTGMVAHLAPRPGAAEVGVRLLKLAAVAAGRKVIKCRSQAKCA
jgi:hypothetical protein